MASALTTPTRHDDDDDDDGSHDEEPRQRRLEIAFARPLQEPKRRTRPNCHAAMPSHVQWSAPEATAATATATDR